MKTCHLIFDCGMVSSDHLNLLEEQQLTYLSAMDKDEMACHSLFPEFVPEPMTKEDYEQILALHEFLPTDENQFFKRGKGELANAALSFRLI